MTSEEFKSDVLPVKDKLYRFALRLLGDAEDAQDIVQEIFLRLWSKRENLSEYRSIEAFAMTMTRNLCLDKLKSPASKKESFDESREMPDNRTPYTRTETTDTIRLVKMAMEALPEQQRMVIHLRDIEECDFDEIAEVTGLSLNNVRVTLSRARKKIRDTLIKINNYEFSKN
ncbi:MAG: RNA polymerase sigma factor [Bacteroidales bacterium]|nr:RNA polymerase sigma factor [Bacteroidales bacterium]